MIIAIGSKNPAKISAVKAAFQNEPCTFVPVDVPSGVSEQPFSDEETIEGATNRAHLALEAGRADIGIGLEGGVHETSHGLFLCNWGALAMKDQRPLVAGGARILLPEQLADRLRSGLELGPVMDEYGKKQNVSKNEGAIGIFTGGRISRAEMFSHIIKLLVGQFEYRLRNERRHP